MGYSVIQVSAVPPSAASHPASSPWDRRINAALGVERFGLYHVDLPAGAETVPHDHRSDGVEDAYVLVRGSGWLVVDGTAVELIPGSAAAVTPEPTRSIRAGIEGCAFVAVCA
jgi:uncharacterized cupin superfamily protein